MKRLCNWTIVQSLSKVGVWYTFENCEMKLNFSNYYSNSESLMLTNVHLSYTFCWFFQAWFYFQVLCILLRPGAHTATSSPSQTGFGGPWWPWPLSDTEIWRVYRFRDSLLFVKIEKISGAFSSMLLHLFLFDTSKA